MRRLKVASQLFLTQKQLPKEQWTTEEEDVAYLTPYMDEVEQEDKARAAFWN